MNIKDILKYFKTEEEIRQSMSIDEVVPILKQNLVEAKNNNDTVIFKVIKIKKSGFQVKVKGIYAFVPFSLMPWKYQMPMWNIIENELINFKFFAKITEIDLSLNRIILDATVTEFDQFELFDGQIYKAIILKKAKSYIFVEIGHRYSWNYGSQTFYISLDSPNFTEIDYYIHSVGDEIELTYINSANNWKKINFERTSPKSQPLHSLDEFNYTKKTTEKKLEKLQAKYDKLLENHTALQKKTQSFQSNSKEKKLINKISKLIQDYNNQNYETTNNI